MGMAGWRSRIEMALSVLKRPASLPFGTANRSLRPSSVSSVGVEWSKSRTVSYSKRRHGAIIAPTPTTARSTDRPTDATGDGDVCGAKDVFVHSEHNSRTACNASAAKTMRCPNCIVLMLLRFTLQLNVSLHTDCFASEWRRDFKTDQSKET